MWRRVVWAALIAALVAGCSSGSGEVEVTGKVTLDGKPVGTGNEAVIRFEPTDGKGKPVEGFVDQGAYTLRVPAGAYKVMVTWNRPTGKKLAKPGAQGPGTEAQESIAEIPAKYNAATTLSAEVSSDKKQHDFALTK